MALKLDDYRLLGRSGLRVSPLALGTMTYGVAGGSWGSSEAEAQAMTDMFIDRGGNFIDTANFYGDMGNSEVWLGKQVKGKRHPLVISTKYSLTTQPGNPNASGNQRKNMVLSVEDSLRRLQTDYIDLLYLHMWDFRTPVDEILRAFDDLVRAGKVLYIGLSDTPAWQASRMQAIAELRGWTQFCALQICYSLIERTVEREMIPMARRNGHGSFALGAAGAGHADRQIHPRRSCRVRLDGRHRQPQGDQRGDRAADREKPRYCRCGSRCGQGDRLHTGAAGAGLDLAQSGGLFAGDRRAHARPAGRQSRRARCRDFG